MKILILILISFFVFTNKCYASSYKIVWDNTSVNVKLNDSYSKYLSIPKCRLYIDDVLVDDAVFNYDYTGDWLYYSKDIDTSKVGSYKVWYKVNETKYKPGTCFGYKQLITFNVIDDIKPTINILNNSLNVKVGTTIKNILDNKLINITDNYTKYEELKIEAIILDSNSSEINKIAFDIVGDYYLKVIVFDSSGNREEKKIKIKVLDNVGPKVTYLGTLPLIVGINKEIDFETLFKVSDFDGVKSFKPTILNLNNKKENVGEATFIYEDIYDNKTEIVLPYEVKKDIKPVINLKEESVVFHYKTDLKTIDFSEYIIDGSYNNLICTSDININTNSLTNLVGEYEVIYSLTKDNLESTKSLIVSLVSYDKPEIITKDAYIKVGESIDFKNYIEIYDESDSNVIDTLEVNQEGFDVEREGVYYLNVTVKNSSGLYNSATLKVIVESSYNFFTTKNIVIIVLLIIISLCSVLYYFLYYKKKHKNNEFIEI